jgi:putative DNA primase/helicase
VDNTGDSFADNCVGSEGGGAAKAYALGKGIIHADKKSMDELKGADWWRAVDGLRSEGYDIPVWVPEKGTPKSDGDEYDRTPLWALCKGAVAPGVVDADDLVEEEGDDGGTYRRFPDKESYNAALDALEEAGIEHGRERRTTVDDVADGVTPEDVDLVKADGGYGYVSYGDDGDVHVDEVTNFTLETDARVEYADDGTKMFKLTVVPRDGETYQVVTRRH